MAHTIYAVSVEFISVLSGATWVLTIIYAPCSPQGRQEFLDWFGNIDMAENKGWLIVGDFNLIRRRLDRNKPGGNITGMLNFNAAISNLRLEELKLSGNKFTWTNKQASLLVIERLYLFFVAAS